MKNAELILKNEIQSSLIRVEKFFKADVVFVYGTMKSSVVKPFRGILEELNNIRYPKNRLVVFLNTTGGGIETVEKMVNITRFHYDEVYFMVPDRAMSSGTIFCMSGDEIYMDYASVLGPIDPQVYNGQAWVPALGYLDKYDEMVQKSHEGTLSAAELELFRSIDLAQMKQYEQAREITITLLKKWLVKYRFSNWKVHQTSPTLKGTPVTQEQKIERAEEIANILSDNKKWHSHSRPIDIIELNESCKLKIKDYSDEPKLREMIRSYNDIVVSYITMKKVGQFLHARSYFQGSHESE